ncbi:DUF3954 domain-containing protein [Carnobacterium mobile]|uniref:DUF3954 domain-containing protein n=1 Tax=Carnobacterium mobile TaxID=2750 RepID=UPI001B8099E1|nr:DUF3954 domain-containing protein [Carnobacterium mobile]
MDNIKLTENAVYVVKNGKLELVDMPKSGFGKTILNWQDGKVISKEISYTIR